MAENVEGFDWSKAEDLAVPQQDAIAVYANADGEMIIRRQKDWNETEDTVIVVAPAYIDRLIGAMQRVARELEA